MVVCSVAFRVLLVVPLLTGALALVGVRPAEAARVCIEGEGIVSETVSTSVLVPEGAFCVLHGSVIRGGLTVEPGGILSSEATDVRGSIVATAPHDFRFSHGEVRGSMTVTGMPPGAEHVSVIISEVRGDILVSGNVAQTIALNFNTVRGSLIFRDNTMTITTIWGNTIGVNLDCSGNDGLLNPAFPLNEVGGAKLGQCVDQ